MELASLLQVSRLDVAERYMRQVRAAKTYHSDEDDDGNIEKEEIKDTRRQQRLLLIHSGPPLKRELSQDKMDFLGNFGLTTNSIADGQLVASLNVLTNTYLLNRFISGTLQLHCKVSLLS